MNYFNEYKSTASTLCNPCPYDGKCEYCRTAIEEPQPMDREKVISTFEKIISVCKEDECDFVDLSFEDAEQILALMKEREAAEPICKIIFNIPYYFCGRCNDMLNMYSTKAMFCSKCGCLVKWGAVKN